MGPSQGPCATSPQAAPPPQEATSRQLRHCAGTAGNCASVDRVPVQTASSPAVGEPRARTLHETVEHLLQPLPHHRLDRAARHRRRQQPQGHGRRQLGTQAQLEVHVGACTGRPQRQAAAVTCPGRSSSAASPAAAPDRRLRRAAPPALAGAHRRWRARRCAVRPGTPRRWPRCRRCGGGPARACAPGAVRADPAACARSRRSAPRSAAATHPGGSGVLRTRRWAAWPAP